ncbi:poly-gamma-glutamate hydrolase family protein [Streptomyces sp. XM83C]|jgi:phage replication-related protein YjqB (UPF0714/DUF867 family)|uniref:poly-gamma-glutamate hydrolase family protein n=1 Tax=unclassified Streptomyces TaxID=2593676 RepID=UPI001FFAEC90|nr:poly-gamma-glutamate hydrolase family protein [Streptomyces sp. XM83C]MCK1821595.1 poly-gamma-glutamate hydrolase family protein [Streptomyces sp. XM83C]
MTPGGRTEHVEIDGVPFTVTLRPRGPVGLLALHADNEGGTGELAEEAGERCGATTLVFRQPGVPDPVHLTSPRMADAGVLLREFLAHVTVTVSLHGHMRRTAERTLFLGGRNRSAARRLAWTLRALRPEFHTVTDLERIPAALRGLHPRNPVNLARDAGVQVELPLLARTSGADDVPPPHVVDALTAGVRLLRAGR